MTLNEQDTADFAEIMGEIAGIVTSKPLTPERYADAVFACLFAAAGMYVVAFRRGGGDKEFIRDVVARMADILESSVEPNPN